MEDLQNCQMNYELASEKLENLGNTKHEVLESNELIEKLKKQACSN